MTVLAEGRRLMDSFNFAIKKGLQQFAQNLKRNFAYILTITTLLFFYMAVFSVNYSASKAIDRLSDIKTVRVFLEEGVDKDVMVQKLSKLQMPATYKYYDKQEAKSRVMRLVPGAKNIEKLPFEFFPEFIEMRIADYAAVDGLITEIALDIEQLGGVRSVEYGKSVGDKLGKIKRTSIIFMLFISLITGIAAAVIIFNTIKLGLYKSQKQIAIYRIVGGTKLFITAPHLVSSFIENTLAYILAMVANLMFIQGVKSYLLKDSYFILFTPAPYVYAFFYILLISTAVLSTFLCVFLFLARMKSINEA
jgi:cell division transport system permease protein